MPFAVGFLATVLVAGMMRHVFIMSGIDSLGKGLLSGLGVGAFIVAPWIAMDNAYSMRDRRLTGLDGGDPILGCGRIGAVLGPFL